MLRRSGRRWQLLAVNGASLERLPERHCEKIGIGTIVAKHEIPRALVAGVWREDNDAVLISHWKRVHGRPAAAAGAVEQNHQGQWHSRLVAARDIQHAIAFVFETERILAGREIVCETGRHERPRCERRRRAEECTPCEAHGASDITPTPSWAQHS